MRMLKMTWMAILALAGFGFVQAANAQANNEPPGVARISLIHGEVSMQRGDSGDASTVDLNTPLVAGDKVFTGTRSRAEIQLDWANLLRLDENAQADIATLERTRIQIQLAQGLANYSVLKGSEADVEINTPNVAVIPLREGRYRIEVNPAGDTLVTVREGEADVSTPEGSTRLKKGQFITVRGTGSDVQFQTARAPSTDDFDKWNNDRDRIIANAEGWRRTNRYYTGAGDLDAYGRWSRIPDYGYVWMPRVAVGWAPYRHGRWMWQAYWGWTWIGAEPWGWAPYHYGRWFVHGGSWVWWPGPVTPVYRPIYAPAYVSFFGFGRGSGFSVGVSFGGGFGSIGWLPAGPCDFVNPWWGRHRNNFNVVNVTNITNITNIYNVRNVNVIAPLRGGHRESNVHNMLVNDRVRFGLSTVSAENFGQGSAAVRTVSTTELRQGHLVAGNLPVVPSRDSLRASDRPLSSSASSRPANQARFFSRRVPSTQRESFSDQSAQLQQAIERDGRLRSSNNDGAGDRSTDNRPAANNGGFSGPSRERNNNVPELNSPRQTQTPAPAQTPASDTRREPSAGWRRFGTGQAGQAAPADSQSNQRAPVLRAPRQRATGSESSPGRPDPTANPARPAQNESRPSEPRSGLPRISSRRMEASDPDRMVAQNSSGNQQSGNEAQSNSNNDRQNGWQRFSGGPRPSSSARGTNATNQTNNPTSPRSDSRPPLELNRPIIQPRTSGNARGSGGSVESAPRGTSPSGNTRVAPTPRSAPDTTSRGAASPSRGTAGGRSVPSTGTRGRAPAERSQAR